MRILAHIENLLRVDARSVTPGITQLPTTTPEAALNSDFAYNTHTLTLIRARRLQRVSLSQDARSQLERFSLKKFHSRKAVCDFSYLLLCGA